MVQMVYKYDSWEDIFASRGYHFLIESVHKAGKFVLYNYEEPLQDHCELQLMLKHLILVRRLLFQRRYLSLTTK
jgi:hypothetical protein